jgi:MFS family permease
MLSRVTPSHERGLYMGVQQTFGGLARVIVPLWAGFAYDHFGKTVPFFTSAVLVGGAIFIGLGVDDGRKRVSAADDALAKLPTERVVS